MNTHNQKKKSQRVVENKDAIPVTVNTVIKSDVQEEINVKADETKVNETVMKTDESVVKVDELVVKADESVVKVDELVVKADETVMKTDETVMKADETVMKTDETVMKADESVVKAVKVSKKSAKKEPKTETKTDTKNETETLINASVSNTKIPKGIPKKTKINAKNDNNTDVNNSVTNTNNDIINNDNNISNASVNTNADITTNVDVNINATTVKPKAKRGVKKAVKPEIVDLTSTHNIIDASINDTNVPNISGDVVINIIEENDDKSRSFKVKLPNDEDFSGRFTGLTPYQAANKALSKYFRTNDNNNISDDQVLFSIKESTRGSRRHEYTYKGTRIKLDQPITYTIKSIDGEDRIITKQYKNQLTKVKKGDNNVVSQASV